MCAEHNWSIVRFLEKGWKIETLDEYESLLWDPAVENLKIPKFLKSSKKVLPFYRPKNFRIQGLNEEEKKPFSGSRVICISGFLSERENEESEGASDEWIGSLKNAEMWKERHCYQLQWEASRRADFLGTAGKFAVEQKAKKKRKGKTEEKKSLLAGVTAATATALTAAGSKATVHVASVMLAKEILSNPWYLALLRAKATGKILAHILNRMECPEGFILVGHSLGARIIYFTLKALKEDPTISPSEMARINDVFLLGGAVSCKNEKGWGLPFPA